MNKNYNIRKGIPADFDALLQLYRACGKDMWDRGFDNWGDFYPPEERIRQDIKEETLFVLEEDDEILGVVVLDFVQPAVYQGVTWQYEGKVMALHRLAIAIHHQKKGLGKVLVDFAEKQAHSLDCDAIRFDAYSINKTLLNFYKKLGYQMTKEAVSLGERWPHLFNCFEKKIDKNES